MYASVQAHKPAREQVLRTLQLLVKICGTNTKERSQRGADPRQKGKTIVFPGNESTGISVTSSPGLQWYVCRAQFFSRLYISLTERLVFLLFVCWWRLGIFDENKCGKWGKGEGAGSECKISCPTKSEVPLCVIHLQIWRTCRIKFICTCCPLFLCMQHFACANPPGSLFRVYPSLVWVRWWPAGCTAEALPPPVGCSRDMLWFVLAACVAGKEPVCTLPLKDYPQYFIAV